MMCASVASLTSSQAHKFSAQELQIQSWGDTSAAMEATALEILDLDPSFITVSANRRPLLADFVFVSFDCWCDTRAASSPLLHPEQLRK